LDHKWKVTGVDFVPRALKTAKKTAPGATLLIGDVTRLGDLGVTGPFDLILDLGCFHSIPDARRDAYVEEVAKVAAPGATFLLFAFGERGPGGIIAPESEIRRRFCSNFDVADVTPGAPFRKQTWYRLIRNAT
jgi:SAM-dependent methyltransferase